MANLASAPPLSSDTAAHPACVAPFVRLDLALKQLRAEIIAIERTFPELKLPQARHVLRRSATEATRRTRRMSAAARKAVSARMKKYWAERRKAQAKVK
jgi:hypothetical protein